MRRSLTIAAAATALAAVAAGPAAASVDPSIRVEPRRLTLGETAVIRGQSWVVGAGCAKRVRVTIQGRSDGERWSAPVGRGRVDPATGGFRLRFTPPQSKFPAGPATIVARQACPDDQGGAFVRRARITLVG
ncbi:MAG: hypothetical protein IRZ32_17240 [Solirubrobacteraceae bacterium]|nr:hypothetical protein [Solirubrobacteraceae bacterium]